MDPLHLLYRPKTFDEVFGQDAQIMALRNAIENERVQSFLLSGPSGVGKTSTARIIAREVGTDESAILEIDAATYTGIDDFRKIAEEVQYRSFTESGKKTVILDECGSLSRNAIAATLKIIEEPPPHVYWIFCTTEISKIPQTLRTRCFTVKFNPLIKDECLALLVTVRDDEELGISDDILELCVDECRGSYRQALINLELCDGIKNIDEAKNLLADASMGEPSTLALCRLLLNPKGHWRDAQSLLGELQQQGQTPEAVRQAVLGYMNSTAIKARDDYKIARALDVIQEFSEPMYAQALLTLAIGRLLYN